MSNIINLNETVRVRLTQKGYDIWKEQVDARNEKIAQMGYPTFDTVTELEQDPEGYYIYEAQLYVLMQYFGQHIGMGRPELFNMNVTRTTDYFMHPRVQNFLQPFTDATPSELQHIIDDTPGKPYYDEKGVNLGTVVKASKVAGLSAIQFRVELNS